MSYLNLVIAVIALIISGFTAYWQFFRKPSLQIIYNDDSPFRKLCSPIDRPKEYPSEWFIRLKIKNNSRVIAKNCIGKITEWYTEGEIENNFDPVRLHWVSNSPEDYTGINLSYHDYDYIDLIYTEKDKQKLCIYTNTHARSIKICFDMKKSHIIKFALYSDNEVAKFKIFKVWFCDDDKEGKLRFIRMTAISSKEFSSIVNFT